MKSTSTYPRRTSTRNSARFLAAVSLLAFIELGSTQVVVSNLSELPRNVLTCNPPYYFTRTGIIGTTGAQFTIRGRVGVNGTTSACSSIPKNVFVFGAMCVGSSPRDRDRLGMACRCEHGAACCDGLLTLSNFRRESESSTSDRLCIDAQAKDFFRQDFNFEISPISFQE